MYKDGLCTRSPASSNVSILHNYSTALTPGNWHWYNLELIPFFPILPALICVCVCVCCVRAHVTTCVSLHDHHQARYLALSSTIHHLPSLPQGSFMLPPYSHIHPLIPPIPNPCKHHSVLHLFNFVLLRMS